MRKFCLILALMAGIVGCEMYDDTKIKESIDQLEKRLSAVEMVQNAYANNKFIKSVIQIEGGYAITFSDGSVANIFNGKDGTNGKDGNNGQNGKDGEVLIQNITIQEKEVTFVLTNGQTFSIPLCSELSITFSSDDLGIVDKDYVYKVKYEVTSSIDDIVVEVVSSANVETIVSDPYSKTGEIEIRFRDIADKYTKIVVLVSNGESTIMRRLSFEQSVLQDVGNSDKVIGPDGGNITLEYMSNMDCDVIIPDSAQEWLSIEPNTRTVEKYDIMLKIEKNGNTDRIAVVKIQAKNSKSYLEYNIIQKGDYEWEDVGVCIYTEDLLNSWYSFGISPLCVKIQVRKDSIDKDAFKAAFAGTGSDTGLAGIYRMVNPYAEIAGTIENLDVYDANVLIYAEDVNRVHIPLQEVGVNVNGGAVMIYSMVDYYIDSNLPIATEAYGFIKGGILQFPVNMVLGCPGGSYVGVNTYYANRNGGWTINLCPTLNINNK